MKVLVTGGAGFIGSHIVDRCLAEGHEVVVVDDLSSGQERWVNPAARFYKLDIRDPQLETVLERERPEVISHQAARANVRESLEQPLLYADVNVLGSLNLLEAARKTGVRKIVYASTGGAVYGEPRFFPVTEDHPVDPLDPYGASKHHVEHYLYLYKANYGLDYTTLRYPNVYGPRQNPFGEAGVVAIFANKLLSGEPPVINGTGEQSRDFVFVGDVAAANVLAFHRASGEILNIGSGVSVSINEIYGLLAELTGVTVPPARVGAKLGEVSRTCLDATRARRELDWAPAVPLAAGLAQTVSHFRV
jgi:UDP-glucose 4-epimerase